jgi:ActR/RegA family two-component response regulator
MGIHSHQQTQDGGASKVQQHSSQKTHATSEHDVDGHTASGHTNNSKTHFHVLLVEGDYDIAQPILMGLEHAGFEAHYTPDMAGALHALQECDLHLIIISLDLANSQAPSLCRTVRHVSNMPLILTGRDCNLTTQVNAFHLGADDYVAHPCDARLLVGRAAALLRRSYHYSQPRLRIAQSGTGRPLEAAQHPSALRNMPAHPQHANQPATHSDHSSTCPEAAPQHPKSQLPKGWATCDTCGYIGPLEKFANPNGKAGFADFHTVLCCPNCQHEDVARFNVGE